MAILRLETEAFLGNVVLLSENLWHSAKKLWPIGFFKILIGNELKRGKIMNTKRIPALIFGVVMMMTMIPVMTLTAAAAAVALKKKD